MLVIDANGGLKSLTIATCSQRFRLHLLINPMNMQVACGARLTMVEELRITYPTPVPDPVEVLNEARYERCIVIVILEHAVSQLQHCIAVAGAHVAVYHLVECPIGQHF